MIFVVTEKIIKFRGTGIDKQRYLETAYIVQLVSQCCICTWHGVHFLFTPESKLSIRLVVSDTSPTLRSRYSVFGISLALTK